MSSPISRDGWLPQPVELSHVLDPTQHLSPPISVATFHQLFDQPTFSRNTHSSDIVSKIFRYSFGFLPMAREGKRTDCPGALGRLEILLETVSTILLRDIQDEDPLRPKVASCSRNNGNFLQSLSSEQDEPTPGHIMSCFPVAFFLPFSTHTYNIQEYSSDHELHPSHLFSTFFYSDPLSKNNTAAIM